MLMFRAGLTLKPPESAVSAKLSSLEPDWDLSKTFISNVHQVHLRIYALAENRVKSKVTQLTCPYCFFDPDRVSMPIY